MSASTVHSFTTQFRDFLAMAADTAAGPRTRGPPTHVQPLDWTVIDEVFRSKFSIHILLDRFKDACRTLCASTETIRMLQGIRTTCMLIHIMRPTTIQTALRYWFRLMVLKYSYTVAGKPFAMDPFIALTCPDAGSKGSNKSVLRLSMEFMYYLALNDTGLDTVFRTRTFTAEECNNIPPINPTMISHSPIHSNIRDNFMSELVPLLRTKERKHFDTIIKLFYRIQIIHTYYRNVQTLIAADPCIRFCQTSLVDFVGQNCSVKQIFGESLQSVFNLIQKVDERMSQPLTAQPAPAEDADVATLLTSLKRPMNEPATAAPMPVAAAAAAEPLPAAAAAAGEGSVKVSMEVPTGTSVQFNLETSPSRSNVRQRGEADAATSPAIPADLQASIRALIALAFPAR